MRYESGKAVILRKREIDRESHIYALEQALAGHSSLESFLVGDKTWNELTEKQQTRLFRQATAVLTFLQLVNKFRYKSNRKQRLLLPEIR